MLNDIMHWYIGVGGFIFGGVVFGILFGAKFICCAVKRKRKN